MSQKRDRLQVIYDMLAAIREKDGKIRPTHLLYKANLSHKMMNEYLDELKQRDFIEVQEIDSNKFFLLTDKGNEYINKFAVIREFMDSFDL